MTARYNIISRNEEHKIHTGLFLLLPVVCFADPTKFLVDFASGSALKVKFVLSG